MVWEFLIPAIAAGLSLLGILIELFMHDRKKAKNIEFAIKRKQREVKKFQKEKDTKAMMAAQKELMGLMGQNMRLRMKSMLVSFPLFIVIFFFLSSSMTVAPLDPAGAQIGMNIKNLADSSREISAELVSDDISVRGETMVSLELASYGSQGDKETIWWNVSSQEGAKTYTVLLVFGNNSENLDYDVVFSKGSLSAGFSPQEASSVFDDSIEVTPIYPPVRINIFGMALDWYIYYIISFFIIAAAISPLKNRILWGHHKGVKHLEKLDSEKNSKNEA
jgi:hypothetical protein